MLSVAIFTLNEEVNLPHCLRSLSPCDDVVVIDSFSTDKTCDISREAGARVFQHEFTGFGDQRMWAFANIKFKHPWVLVLDADERVTPELWAEMNQKISLFPDAAAFRMKRRFFWCGKWLRYANLYPSWIVRLVRVGKVKYVNRGHAETQELDGPLESLDQDLIDENHKGFDEWLERQRRYAEKEAEYETSNQLHLRISDLFSADPLMRRNALKGVGRKMPLRGFWYFLYSYFLRLGWLDGWTGFRFCLEKARMQGLISNLSKQKTSPS